MITRLDDEILVLVLQRLSAHDLLTCERVCKRWNTLLYVTQSYLWKLQARNLLQCKDTRYFSLWTSAINYFSDYENWKAIYRTCYEWSKLDLSCYNEQNPAIISTDKIISQFNKADTPNTLEINCEYIQYKLGQVEAGIVIHNRVLNQRVVYNYGGTKAYELQIFNWNEKDGPSIKVGRFDFQFLGDISCIPKLGCDLEAFSDTINNLGETRVVVWDPKLNPKGPSLFDTTECSGSGIWFLQGRFQCVGIRQRILIVQSLGTDPKLHAFELRDTRGTADNICNIQHSNNVVLQWSTNILQSFGKIKETSFNESVISVLAQLADGNYYVTLYWVHSGQVIKIFPVSCRISAGFESVQLKINLTRFHLVVYNSNYMGVYNLLSTDNMLPRITKLPYVGRNIKMEISLDGSMFLLGPTRQHGEVVLVDLFKKTTSSYLLKNGFIGNSPKKGCWLVFQKQMGRLESETQVIWSPIFN
jgi:hypothetical protein